MVFYRKYRPQTIDQLDSENVRKNLTAVLTQNQPPHAFLFTGPKGLGKTSTARIVAKVVNCSNRKNGIEPCNACDQCLAITQGSHVDIVEIDGASNRNIDDVRDLREKIKLSPASAKRKVYIIDEVHMFTNESFNALLKTLEEPPTHAMFILCTTEKNKVPATIVSRCFTIDFKPATDAELERSFLRIAKGENLQIEPDALAEIIQLSEKGFRDGAKIIEELAAQAVEGQITKTLVESRYKLQANNNLVHALSAALEKKDMKKGLATVQQAANEGIDFKLFLSQLLSEMHTVLLIKAGIKKDEKIKYTFSLPDLQTLIALLSESYREMKFAVLPQLPLELAIVSWCGNTHEIAVSETVSSSTVSNQGVTVASMRKHVGEMARIKALYGEEKKEKPAPQPENAVSGIALTDTSNTEITPEWLNHFWQSVITEIKKENHTLAGVLRGCKIQSFDKKTLIIETAFKFHKEKLADAKTQQAIETICKMLTGNSVAVRVVLNTEERR